MNKTNNVRTSGCRAAATLMLTAMLAAGAPHAMAHDLMTLDEMMEAFGWDFDTAEVTVEKVTDRLHVLFGIGGNVGVLVGAQGTLIVDDQFPQMIGKLNAAIRGVGGGDVDFAVNTHWHFDHAEGNLTLGPAGTWIVAQANSRQMMHDDHIVNLVGMQYNQQAYPPAAKPVITYDNAMQFHFNGERIDLMHFGPAHTTGDTAVIFRGSNAVHMGDVFNNSGYPFIDADNGGSLDGMITFCQAVIDAIDTQTTVIPGHGPITDYQAMVDYVTMLKTVRGRIADMISAGKTLQDVVDAKPTADFDERYGDSTIMVDRSYASLKRDMGR